MASRLTCEDWSEIERLYRSGSSAKTLERRFGIRANTIHRRASAGQWRATRVRAAAPSALERLESVAARLEAVVKQITGSQE